MRRLQDEKSLPNIICLMITRRLRWAELVVQIRDRRGA
jgi:hypothetical protein